MLNNNQPSAKSKERLMEIFLTRNTIASACRFGKNFIIFIISKKKNTQNEKNNLNYLMHALSNIQMVN